MMLQKSAQVILLLLSLCFTSTVFAQEEVTPIPVNPSLDSTNLYLAETQWDGAWNLSSGLWVLGGREDQSVVAVNIESVDDGATFEGEITYAGEGPIAFRAKREDINVYSVEVQWGGDDAEWNPESWWVIGGPEIQPVVAVHLTLSDDARLEGQISYAGEDPIAFRGTPVDGSAFYTETQWGDGKWRADGVWVLGGRSDQQAISVAAASADEGMTLEGEMTYEGEGPIGFRATQLFGNVYVAEVQWGGDDAEWNFDGYWMIGSNVVRQVVGIDLAGVNGILAGTITYAGQVPVNFNGLSLQMHKAEADALRRTRT